MTAVAVKPILPFLQPSAEVGYLLALSEHWNLAFAAAFGFEINVQTDGRDVGEGPIGLLGVVFSHRVN